MKLWHPQTERPDGLCCCLIATPPDDDSGIHTLAGEYYTWDPRSGVFRGEETDIPLRASVFFWAREADVLHELEVKS